MADQLVLVRREREPRAEEIIQSFARRTGLKPQDRQASVVFELGPEDHRIDIVQTLTQIDSQWSEYLALGDPAADPESH